MSYETGYYAPSIKNDKMIVKLIEVGRLDVRPETGEVFSTAPNARHRGKLGLSLGSLTAFGYIKTTINYEGKRYFFMVHRIIYIAVNGIPPMGSRYIDHVNGIRTDNRSSNLEAVSMLQNTIRAMERDKSNTIDIDFDDDDDDDLGSTFL